MKVLIDATGVTNKEKAGVGVYAKNLLDHLTRADTTFEWFILAQDDDPELDLSRHPNVTMLWVPARVFRILPFRLLLEQMYLPFLLKRRGIEVIHSLHYAFPLLRFGTRQVVTFHDMTFFNMPEVHERLKVLYFRFFMRAGVRSADRIIFVSHSAQADCIARLGKPRGQTSVIPHGKNEAFRPGISLAGLDHLQEKYGLPKRFVLYIGTVEPRKNLPRLIEAFASIAAENPDLHLVIAGKKGWMTESLFATIKKFDLTSRIVFTGFIAEAEKPLFLAACTLFVYPSLYEGFGLPALEAIACGAPTITSNTSALPEVVGDAAILIDPANTAALAEAMQSVLLDPVLRKDLQTRGPLQAAQFTWEKAATLSADVYRSLGSSGQRRGAATRCA